MIQKLSNFFLTVSKAFRKIVHRLRVTVFVIFCVHARSLRVVNLLVLLGPHIKFVSSKYAAMGTLLRTNKIIRKFADMRILQRVKLSSSGKTKAASTSGLNLFKLAGRLATMTSIVWVVHYTCIDTFCFDSPPYLPREDGFTSLDTHFSLQVKGIPDLVKVSKVDDLVEVSEFKVIQKRPNRAQIEILELVDRFSRTKAGKRWCRSYWAFLRAKPRRERMSTTKYDAYEAWLKDRRYSYIWKGASKDLKGYRRWEKFCCEEESKRIKIYNEFYKNFRWPWS